MLDFLIRAFDFYFLIRALDIGLSLFAQWILEFLYSHSTVDIGLPYSHSTVGIGLAYSYKRCMTYLFAQMILDFLVRTVDI